MAEAVRGVRAVEARPGRRRRPGATPLLLLLGLAALLGFGCERGSSRATGPTGPSVTSTASTRGGARTVTAALADWSLYEHNAQFNGDRTFRWVPPIPIYFVSGDTPLDNFVFAQFAAWEVALAGVGGTPLYEARPAARSVPPRGIFFAIADLPGSVVGVGDPFSPLAQARQSPLVQALRRGYMPESAPRRLEVPEVQATGAIRRCQISLDPDVLASDAVFAAVVRHEIGHCLGFIGHVPNPRSLMHATSCCPLTITTDVVGVMRTLYGLPPGTPVTPVVDR